MTNDELFLNVMHRFADAFEEHAVLKGGMALRLFQSQRATVDIDYVFVPYKSKLEIVPMLEDVLAEIPDAAFSIATHSKMVRIKLSKGEAAIQIEINVAEDCRSTAASTATLARALGVAPRVVRLMEPSTALSHKIAAWNERRLLRDLYDVYFMRVFLNVAPDMTALDLRLENIDSRLPALKRRKRMSREELCAALESEAHALTQERIDAELAGLLPNAELPGLPLQMRAGVNQVVADLRRA